MGHCVRLLPWVLLVLFLDLVFQAEVKKFERHVCHEPDGFGMISKYKDLVPPPRPVPNRHAGSPVRHALHSRDASGILLAVRPGSGYLFPIMKNQRNWLGVAVLVWSLPCGLLLAEPPAHHITVKVTVESSNDYKKIADSSEKSHQQDRQLVVTLANNDKEQVKDVSMKWAIYAHKMENHQLVIL